MLRQLKFAGHQLELNYSTSGAGRIRVEIQDDQRKPIPGYTLEDSSAIYGDDISRIVTWGDRNDVSKLVGRPIRLRFVMNEADVYSLRFPVKKPQS